MWQVTCHRQTVAAAGVRNGGRRWKALGRVWKVTSAPKPTVPFVAHFLHESQKDNRLMIYDLICNGKQWF